ncbi:MAG: ADP-ribosylglycohydrolase family protein [Gloeocapsa sp. UFS-A4-WI-NPMV-4B04]|jgi:hypothetical protein|nr:ADP-ribosylglycohydrolase family protein [Gloeocapsa sp. UFS-A4-WI-NPMV-4B04]
MRYSISSRFGATFVGAVIGETIGSSKGVSPRRFSYPNAIKPHQEKPLDRRVEQQKYPVAAKYLGGRLAIIGAERLIKLGRFDLDDWHDAFTKDLLAQDVINCNPTIAILATLPIALFYHESEIKLRQNLQLALKAVGQDDAMIRDRALAVGYAIALSLNEKINPATLIPQVITFLGEPQTQITQQLLQVQTLLNQQAGLERAIAVSRDATTPIALAFYCFLSSLEDFRLSTLRAAQTSYQPQITTAIVGALSGAYNSISGIPISWRMALLRFEKQQAGWETTEVEMLQVSDALVSVWSGVYDQVTHPTDSNSVAAIASPRVIKPR